MYQYFLKGINTFVGYGHAVNLTNFVANMKRRLSMNHASMHDARHNATSIFGNLQRNALEEENINTTQLRMQEKKKNGYSIHRSTSMLTTI